MVLSFFSSGLVVSCVVCCVSCVMCVNRMQVLDMDGLLSGCQPTLVPSVSCDRQLLVCDVNVCVWRGDGCDVVLCPPFSSPLRLCRRGCAAVRLLLLFFLLFFLSLCALCMGGCMEALRARCVALLKSTLLSFCLSVSLLLCSSIPLFTCSSESVIRCVARRRASHAERAMQHQLCSTSYAAPAMQHQLCRTSHAGRAMQRRKEAS